MRNCFLVLCAVFCASGAFAAPPVWEAEAPGVWKARVGAPEAFDLLTAANAKPAHRALAAMGDAAFPLAEGEIDAVVRNGKTLLRFPLAPESEEQIYGLGLQFKKLSRRKSVYHLKVDHYGGEDNGSTHAPVPFYVSSKGYGVFINTARYVSVYPGTSNRHASPNFPQGRDRTTDKSWAAMPASDTVEVYVPAAGVEVLVFGGTTPLEAVRRYNLYCGGGVLPPKWGLGFTYRTHTKYSAEQVIAEVAAFEEQAFPLDFIGLEPGWQSWVYPCSYVWDPERFPDAPGFVAALLEKGVRTNLWMNPYVSEKSPLYEKMLPLSGSHTVWLGIAPDYSMAETRGVFQQFYEKTLLAMGVGGLKIDECDGYDKWLWPETAQFPSGLDPEQLRQTYGLLLQRMAAESHRKANRRTYGLVRASNGGAPSLPFVIYNDYYDHRNFITALCNASFSGVLWTPEARASKTPEEWLRRIQSVCFSPMAMINAWSSGTKPWSFPEVYPEVREIANLRMRFLPYLYTAFARYHFDGTPPFRAMPLAEGFDMSDLKKAGVSDQYMMGDSLLVAPMFTGETERSVLLPAGKWYDFYTGALAGKGCTITVAPGLERIPLFVKDGGIIPLMPARLRMPAAAERVALEARHYGTKESVFRLYDDDGETFDYEKGAYSWTALAAERGADGRWTGAVRKDAEARFGYAPVTWRFMPE